MFFKAIGSIIHDIQDDLKAIFVGGMKMLECLPGLNSKRFLPKTTVYSFINLQETGKITFYAN